VSALKVFLAVPPGLVLHGIRRAIEDVEDIEVVGEAAVWQEVLPGLRSRPSELVLLDTRLPGGTHLVTIDLIREAYPELKIVVLSERADEGHIEAVLQRGANGYIVKTIEPRDLASALRQTAEGLVYHALTISAGASDAAARAVGLTARELTILQNVSQGLSNRQIAAELSVTEQTVKFHLTNVYRKLGVPNRLSAARYAYEHGIARPMREGERSDRA
jgi:DNA-binding NarL/FixJ family response regulator